MKKTRIIIDEVTKNILICVDISSTIQFDYASLTADETIKLNAFLDVCEAKKPIIPLPTDPGQPVFTIPETCPLDSTLTPKVYYMAFEKNSNSFKMDILVTHFKENGDRITKYDVIDSILADMSEERKVDVTPAGFIAVEDALGVVRLEPDTYILLPEEKLTKITEYSFVLANSMIGQGMSIPQLIGMSAQIWYADGDWLRIYN